MPSHGVPSLFPSAQMRKWEMVAHKCPLNHTPHENQFIAQKVNQASEHRLYVVAAVYIAIIFALISSFFLLKVADVGVHHIKIANIIGIAGGGIAAIVLLVAYYIYEFGGPKKAAQAIENDKNDQLFNALKQQGLDAVKRHVDATTQHYQWLASQTQARLDALKGGRELSSPR